MPIEKGFQRIVLLLLYQKYNKVKYVWLISLPRKHCFFLFNSKKTFFQDQFAPLLP